MWPEKYSPRLDDSFWSHLEELRGKLLACLAVFLVGVITSFLYAEELLNFFVEPLQKYQSIQLYFHRPYEAFLTQIKVALVTGFVVTAPFHFIQVWSFVAPGLYAKEKKTIIPLAVASIFLFWLGVAFAYYCVIPWGLHFLLSYQTSVMKPLLGVGPYFSFLIGMLLAFGFLFNFPVFVLGFVQLGLLRTRTLKKSRKMMIVILFILAAILTPSPDPVSQLMLATPLLVLYEASILLAGWLEKKKHPHK